MKHHAIQLYDYHVWANAKLINHLQELPGELYDKEVQSVFPSVSVVMGHIYLMDTTWLGVMRNDSFEEIVAVLTPLRESIKNKSLLDMKEMYLNMTEQYRAFFARQEDLDKLMTCEHPTYGKLNVPMVQLVQHVVNHGTYHRGNITAMLRQLGFEGVPTDYIFYLYAAQANL
ncbi:Uncharacterized damage-inducible protein DinB (forms a four-helix bundle) [Paenibacillus sp. 1_12]|uniref:DinB family protein n=1 Tax=Paenibacillus sp. 1_12 TaxID=1566278 RepID=UPI0008DFFD09|nr:DinB family protein [Paenibacillus sp. 1_12]SFL25826.1 Uncharacterized damage-inducible protein DinB (forms a four-helix bundle) [Paenibacillus sp. 1_12]